ncbi:hypothetical protein SGL43_04751 [Streptomyces globisporus]|uniref:Uncharacterized protein n=1 Tax=Streptomyces globisporus TaxID=1908 RepID=A0ABN8V7P0_STRGL|nr:hypothetical protein SGL43_04751 [Streptomyces globisporus]
MCEWGCARPVGCGVDCPLPPVDEHFERQFGARKRSPSRPV